MVFVDMIFTPAVFIDWNDHSDFFAAFGLLVVVKLSIETTRCNLKGTVRKNTINALFDKQIFVVS